MKNKILLNFLLQFLLINSVFINHSFALTDDQASQQQLIIQQQQEQQRQQEANQQRIDEAERIRKTRIGIDGGADDDSGLFGTDESSVNKDGTCKYEFKLIVLNGRNVIGRKTLKKDVLGKYLGKCITKTNIQAMQSELMKYYIDNGYTNARIYFDFGSQDKIEELKKGTFNIVIEEGKVRNIELNDVRYNNRLEKKIEKTKAKGKSETEISEIKESPFHKFRNNMQKFFAFPFLESKEFNLRDYEQGLDQINRLQSSNAKMDIRAVDSKDPKDAGYSDIVITNTNSFPISLNVGAENSGNKNTGERNGYIGTNIDNLLSVNDNIYLKYTQDLDWENSVRYNKAFYGSLSVPLGYWTLSSSVNYSKYLTTVNGYYTTFHTHGDTLTQTYNLDRVMYRRQLYKINAGTELTLRDAESWIRDYKSETGSRKSTNINFYLNNLIYTKFGTIIIKPSYQKGLSWFNAKKDDNDLLDTEARNQYDLVKLYAYYNTKVNIPLFTKSEVKDKNGQAFKIRNKLPLNYTLTFNSQYSWNTLYGTDQFSIGGEWTVRGFRNNTISGDNGYSIRNDLRVRLVDLLPNCIINTKPMKFGNTIKGKQYNLSINDALSRTTLSLFYDYGFIKDKYGDSDDIEYNSQHGYMAGTGLALNYYGKYLDWSLTYAKALHSPNYLENRDAQKKENQSVYWRTVVKF
ncbi:MAG TPA: ShlB/FhaC/HecB family hemolysin secretion/activation protein [Rickettsiales bacterium]|nr:ShlB/FhaC/HecB family hemolysin secretion/activation protein [Rickettsiales bacterium]